MDAIFQYEIAGDNGHLIVLTADKRFALRRSTKGSLPLWCISVTGHEKIYLSAGLYQTPQSDVRDLPSVKG